MITAIVEGKGDLADFLWLVAFVLGVVATVTYVMAKNISMALVSSAIALVALGWFVI